MIRVTLCVFILVEFSIASFFHKETYSLRHRDDSYFGYSLEYQNEKQRLIVGVPKEDQNGQLYSCPIKDLGTSNACGPLMKPEKIQSLLEGSDRSGSPEQQFFLGASVAATKDYVFTCAPLMTQEFIIQARSGTKNWFQAWGTCFLAYNVDNVTRFTGLMEQYLSKKGAVIDLDSFFGGVGWDTLVDDTNDLILISKPALTSNIMYTSAKNPMQPVVSVVFGDEPQEKLYKGCKLVAGNFFSDHKTVYAYSSQYKNLRGVISFLRIKNNTVNVMKIRGRSIEIQSKQFGNGFGAALNSADLNNDGYSELLVGAPLQADKNGFNAGAVYIYVGGQIARMKFRSQSSELNVISIAHRKDGSHFGTAIASLDLDGDNWPEIFVSAPFEEGGGSVYIVSGYEINKLLKARLNTFVTDIPSHQRIHSELQAFGYSLKPVADYDRDVLFIGAPLSSAVEMYRSVPTIHFTISAYLKGKEMVRELDQSFTVTVKIDVQYPTKPENISGELLVTISIGDEERAVISSGKSYTIKLSRQKTTYTKDIVVTLNDQRPGFYEFTATVALKPQDGSAESSVRLSEHSLSQKKLDIVRKCKGDECVPHLSMTVTWSGSERYVLGSSSSETVVVLIRNDGNTSYESCAKMKIIGAQVKDSECVEDSVSSYTCKFIELEREKPKVLQIELDMTRSSSEDDKLEVDVFLYSNCLSTKQNPEHKKLTVMYDLDTSDINISEQAIDRKVSDQEIADLSKSKTIEVHEKYKITNNGSVRWKLRAELTLKRKSFIESYLISEQGSNVVCNESIDKDNFGYNCVLTVEKKSDVYILTTINIFKEKIAANLQDDKLQMVSELRLHLDPTTKTKTSKSIATLTYKKDLGFGQKKSYVLVFAILIAVIIVLIIGLILHMKGFFIRSEKKKLEQLKARVSVKRSGVQDAGPCDASNVMTFEESDDLIIEDEVENTLEEYKRTSVTVHRAE